MQAVHNLWHRPQTRSFNPGKKKGIKFTKEGKGDKFLLENLRRIVLDVLKPHEPNIVEMAQEVAKMNGVEGVNITLYEIDHHVENAKVTVEGNGLAYQELKDLIEKNGAAIHSIDEVAAGHSLIEDVVTHQD